MDSQEVIDAELSARVLRLINVTDSGLHSQVDQQKKGCLVFSSTLYRQLTTVVKHIVVVFLLNIYNTYNIIMLIGSYSNLL